MSETRVPRGPNAERRADTRAKIMDAAVRCLAQYGYAATSTPLVARTAKVSRGSLLHQFPTKVDLVSGQPATLVRVEYPEGESKVLASSGDEKVSVYEGKATVKMRLRLAPEAKAVLLDYSNHLVK